MATARPFGYNPYRNQVSGSGLIGDISYTNTTTNLPDFSITGVTWWNGPDEELGWVICRIVEDDPSLYQGLEWNSTTDTYVRKGTVSGVTISVSAGNENLPIHSLMKRCLLNDDGTVNYYLYPDNSALKSGGTASDLTGTDGQVMVEIPKFYYNIDVLGNVKKWYISLYPLSGYQLHPAFYKDGVAVDYRYYSAFEGSMWDATTGAMVPSGSIATSMYASGDKMCSVIDQWAKTNETRTEYRTMSAERGPGWRQLDFYLNSAVQLLYLIEFANFNSQSMIGNGRTNLSGGDWIADSYIGKTGYSVVNGNNSGNVSNGGTAGFLTDYMSYRGIENWYGNVWKMIDGITWDGTWTGVASAQPVYVTNNSLYFADQGSTNMTHLCDASYIGITAGYITNIENSIGFIPSSVGGSSTTKLCDYYWQYIESGLNYWRVVLFGAAAYHGGQSGGFAVNVGGAWSYASVDVAGRLCF